MEGIKLLGEAVPVKVGSCEGIGEGIFVILMEGFCDGIIVGIIVGISVDGVILGIQDGINVFK